MQTATRLDVTVPELQPGHYPVTVQTAAGTSNALIFNIPEPPPPPAPVLTDISPQTAVVGTVLTLTGDHFMADSVVYIGAVVAPIVP